MHWITFILTVVVAAYLRQHLPNVNEIFLWLQKTKTIPRLEKSFSESLHMDKWLTSCWYASFIAPRKQKRGHSITLHWQNVSTRASQIATNSIVLFNNLFVPTIERKTSKLYINVSTHLGNSRESIIIQWKVLCEALFRELTLTIAKGSQFWNNDDYNIKSTNFLCLIRWEIGQLIR